MHEGWEHFIAFAGTSIAGSRAYDYWRIKFMNILIKCITDKQDKYFKTVRGNILKGFYFSLIFPRWWCSTRNSTSFSLCLFNITMIWKSRWSQTTNQAATGTWSHTFASWRRLISFSNWNSVAAFSLTMVSNWVCL